MIKDALISDNGRYRHWLKRQWNTRLSMVTIIGLNPSTADEIFDDKTITRCIGFVQRLGYGGFYMVNLFDYRATKPKDLNKALSPLSFEADQFIDWCVRGSDKVIFAWGSHNRLMGRNQKMINRYPDAYCFGKTKDGHPKHPLFLKANTELINF